MGIYIFDTDVLVRELARDAEESTSHDFGRDIVPKLVAGGARVYAYLFWDENKKEAKYWRDVGTLDAYYEASMDLDPGGPRLQPLRPGLAAAHLQPQLPSGEVRIRQDGRRGVAAESIVSTGCIVSGGNVQRLGPVSQRARALVL
jgi:glucose-1-phosphate adenylyltransferase